jgi:hypothetical protein
MHRNGAREPTTSKTTDDDDDDGDDQAERSAGKYGHIQRQAN